MKLLNSAAAIALTALLAGPAGAAMTSPEYNGVITDCTGLCDSFGAENGLLLITSDIVFPDGGGVVTDVNAVSNVTIAITLIDPNTGMPFNPNQELGFINGGATSVNLTIDAAGNPTAGTILFDAVGATSNFPATADIDVDAGTFSATVLGNDVGGGNGSFGAPIPVPAAVWLFGSALAGLAGFTRRRAA